MQRRSYNAVGVSRSVDTGSSCSAQAGPDDAANTSDSETCRGQKRIRVHEWISRPRWQTACDTNENERSNEAEENVLRVSTRSLTESSGDVASSQAALEGHDERKCWMRASGDGRACPLARGRRSTSRRKKVLDAHLRCWTSASVGSRTNE